MDSNELREMSIANAKMALEQARRTYQASNTITNTPIRNYRITERHKVGIGKMIEYFGSLWISEGSYG